MVVGKVMSGVSGVLKANRGQEEIVRRGLELFAQCAELSRGSGSGSVQQTAAIKDKEKGVMDSVLAVMDAMKDNQDIQQLCSQLIPTLSNTEKGKETNAVTSALQDTSAAISGGEQQAGQPAVQRAARLAAVDAGLQRQRTGRARARYVGWWRRSMLLHGHNADAAGSGVRVGVMSSAAHVVHRLMKERQVEVCGAMMSGGMAHAMVQSAVAEQCESVSSSVTPLIAVLAADASNAADLMKDGTVQGMLTLAKQHHLNEQIVHDTTKTIGLVVQQNNGNISKIVEWGSAEVLIDSLLTHHADLHRTQETLQVINTVTAQPASVPSFLSMDSISAIMEIMKVYASQPDILTLSMQCLAHFLVNQDAAQEVGQLNGCALLVKAMRDHYMSEELCEIDMILLHSLSSLPANVELLLDPELATVELVKWVANKYAKNQVLVEAGQKLLTALDVRKEEPLDLLNSFDGTQADLILSRLRNPNVSQQDMLSLLSSLAGLVNSAEKADILAAKGGVSLLAGCVNRNVKNETLFFGSAAALLRVCDHLSEGVVSELARAEVLQALAAVINSGQLGFGTTVSAGDLTSAVRAMGRLKMKEDVVKQILQHNPLKTLMSVIYNSDDQRPAARHHPPRVQADQQRRGGRSDLAHHQPARAHPGHATGRRRSVVHWPRTSSSTACTCWAIWPPTTSASRTRSASRAAYRSYCSSSTYRCSRPRLGFVEYCTLALANLSLNSSNNQAFIVASRGIPLLLELITQHNRATDLLENAVCVLCNVCYRNDSNKDAILQLSGAKILVATALANFSAVPVLMSCFRTLGNLAYSPPSTSTIIGAGAVQALVAGMSIHGSNGELCLLCLRVLTNLCSDYVEGNMSTMREEGAVQAVVEVCRTHASSQQPADMLSWSMQRLLCSVQPRPLLCQRSARHPTVHHGRPGPHHSRPTTLTPHCSYPRPACSTYCAHTHPADLDRMLDGGVAPAVKEAMECKGAVRRRRCSAIYAPA